MSQEVATLSAFDAELLDGAAASESPNQLSARVGGVLSPAECVLRVRALLAERDVWTDPERKKLLLYRVYGLVDEMTELARTTMDGKDYSGLTKALDLLRKVLAEQEGATDAELQRLVELQANAMLGFIDAALKRATDILTQQFPDVSKDAIELAFEEALLDVREGN